MAQETTQYEQEVTQCQQGERVLTAVDGCTIAQTPDGAVAITTDARIALGRATHAAACWRDDRKACAVALTDEEGSPRHRVAFLTTKGLVDTVECGPSVAPQSHVTGAAFRAGDGALGVLYGDGALRVALLGLDGGRVVEEAACVSTAAAGGTALAVVGDRFAVGAADGSCAVVKARLCAVLGQAAIARDLDLPASEAGEPIGEAPALGEAPVGGDGKLYITNEEGITVVLAAGPEFKQLSVNELDGSFTLSSPVAVGDRLYLRTGDFLYCLARSKD